MKIPMNLYRGVFLLGLVAIAMSFAQASYAMESASQMIRANALLGVVYKKDPAAGNRFANEIQIFLDSSRQGEVSKDGAPGPRFRRRGGPGGPGADPESEMERQNKKVFEENPALRKMYFHSPVAYLRMLKRLRQAAGSGSQAVAQ